MYDQKFIIFILIKKHLAVLSNNVADFRLANTMLSKLFSILQKKRIS